VTSGRVSSAVRSRNSSDRPKPVTTAAAPLPRPSNLATVLDIPTRANLATLLDIPTRHNLATPLDTPARDNLAVLDTPTKNRNSNPTMLDTPTKNRNRNLTTLDTPTKNRNSNLATLDTQTSRNRLTPDIQMRNLHLQAMTVTATLEATLTATTKIRALECLTTSTGPSKMMNPRMITATRRKATAR